MPKDLVLTGQNTLIPSPIAAAGTDAVRRFIEFFTATIRNPNTRGAYARAVSDFFSWCHTVDLRELGAFASVRRNGL